MMRYSVDIKTQLRSGDRSFSLNASFASVEDFTVLFGPSGSGKSLTLKCMAGILRPDSGRIAFGEKVYFDSAKGTDVPARNRRLGFVFQDYALFPHLSVAQNIGFAFGKRFMGGPSSDEKKRVTGMLEMLGLEDIAGARPAEVSGGQRQRTALARALITRPEALLLDEPFSALDTVLRAKMRAELKSLQARHDIPVVIITHDPADVEAFQGTVVEYSYGCTKQALTVTNKTGNVWEEGLCFG